MSLFMLCFSISLCFFTFSLVELDILQRFGLSINNGFILLGSQHKRSNFTARTLGLQVVTHYKARKYFTDGSLESFIPLDHRMQVLIVN